MEIHLPDDDAKLYSRLHVSSLDLDLAKYCVGVILKKGWHYQPWEKRGTIYLQQSTFTSALVTAYARPFTESHGWPKFPPDLKEFDGEENKLHDQLIELRNTIYAHSQQELFDKTLADSELLYRYRWSSCASHKCRRSSPAQTNDTETASRDTSRDDRAFRTPLKYLPAFSRQLRKRQYES